jgi:putative transposase
MCPARKAIRVAREKTNRLFLEGVLWIARVGAPWRDLPETFGNWHSVFQRFRRWALKGVFERLFQLLSDDPDFEYGLIDGTRPRPPARDGRKRGLKIRRSGVRAAV